jgi:ABC-type multidrug transport system ATPase subunit
LLHNIWGEVPKKEITAIMGPSGAGKSTLLNILAGRTRTKGNLTVSADVRLDNFSVDPTDVEVRKQIAFVAQDDSLNATSTPREAIRFSAKLRLPRTTTEEELDALVSWENLYFQCIDPSHLSYLLQLILFPNIFLL